MDISQVLSLVLIPILFWVIRVERRLTRIETMLKLNNPQRKEAKE